MMKLLRIAAVVAATICLQLGAQAADRPNVVVIISDDAGWADYGFMRDAIGAADPSGRGAVPTPSLDQIASRGVTFTNAYTGSVCSPSRAMLTTGQYGPRFGYASNIRGDTSPIHTANTVQGLPTEITTVWEHMQGAGYSTAAIGKWHLGEHANGGGQLGNRPENQGVEVFQGLWGGSRNYFVGNSGGTAALRETLSDGAGGVTSNGVIESNYAGQYVTDVFGDQSANYIRDNANSDEPFFLYASFTAPHTPMQATDADLAYIDSLGDPGFTGNRRTYAAMHYAMDRNVGKILSALEDPDGNPETNDGVAENTLVIFINDNGGDCCDSSPNASDNGDLRHGKGSQYEGGMRVPMIVAGAGVESSKFGTVSHDLVHSIDIVPTALVGAAGHAFEPGAVIDGVNLLPYINGTTPGVAHEHLLIPRFNNQQSALRLGKWKYMYQTGPGYQLYDMEADISESNNVIGDAANAAVVEQAHQLMASYHVQFDKPRHDNQAPETNQFDHFRFREDQFATASFSTSNAWTNGETGNGRATASWRDGYANNVLTFRTKPTGDYKVSNDLSSVAGLAYMANQINLISNSSPLTIERQATIDGLPVLLTNSLDGDGPKINLDATDALSNTFTFNVDHDIEIYDNLVVQGDGNQNFNLNGQLREFREGRSITKTGSSTVWFGGGTDISGQFDLQQGKAEFSSAAIKTSGLTAQPGTTVSVGGDGFGESKVSVIPGPQPVTSNLLIEYDAARDASGDNSWQSTSSGSSTVNLGFEGNATTVPVSDATFGRLSAAYDIQATGGASSPGSDNNFFESGDPVRSKTDGTFEVVFNVKDTTAGSEQVLLDIGGTRGLSLTLDNSTLKAAVNGDAETFVISEDIATGWHHAVISVDLDSSGNDSWSLFVDNTEVGAQSNLVIGDWAGGNNWGVGAAASATLAPIEGATAQLSSPNVFHGDIALWRYYHNLAFASSEVDTNYKSLLMGDSETVEITSTTLSVEGNYSQHTGARLELDLLDTGAFDSVAVNGTATLSGELVVAAIDGFTATAGDTFAVLNATSRTGEFEHELLPTLEEGLMWQVRYDATAVTLAVTLAGDYNGDGTVNLADYSVWRDSLGQSVSELTRADGNGDGAIDVEDYKVWKANFGRQIEAGEASQSAAVPEPGSLGIAMLSLTCLAWRLSF